MNKLKSTGPKPIHFKPTERTESVIVTLRRNSRIARGPMAAVLADYAAGLVKGGKVKFVEHQLLAVE